MNDLSLQVHPAHVDDIPAIKQIAEAHKPMLGFVSRGALNTALLQGTRLVAVQGGLILVYLRDSSLRHG